MTWGLTLVLSLVAIAAVWRLRYQNAQERLFERLHGTAESADIQEFYVQPTVLGRYNWFAWIALPVVAASLFIFLNVPIIFAVTFGVVAALLVQQLDTIRLMRLEMQLEMQLADAIELIISGLQAGSGFLGALEHVVRDTRRPLKPVLEDVQARLRFGDEPHEVFDDLARRVPLEPYRLLGSALRVHWTTGSRLVPLLTTVARSVRNRIEVSRHVRLLTTHARVSLVSMLLATYFVAFIMWRFNPEQMGDFLQTTIGEVAVAVAILLQAVGIIWIARMSRLRY